ncbi:glucose-6-phosphate dehydrogenase [Nocardioides anomalus]|uniref:Glucose-6-phosphate dehydrogenase n=1 Tax=Nocardioides anomalus TaxID=2712223 RepID=A0A6G6WCI6_9ACTN|nr:glucose-6-phosphate dehydrogenase [Nocardioides anomalus]QIG42863.1 glucose-6-phosphate dehydrogenase [Nocardioides anomalus]
MTPTIGTLLVLGADGDLARRLMLPGLASLLASDWAPGRSLRLIGTGLSELDDAAWRRRVEEAMGTARGRVAETVRHSHYETHDVTSVEELRGLLEQCEGTPAIFFALPPAVTARVCQALRLVDLPEGTVLAMEKPFGTGLVEARSLNELVTTLVPEEQVFRIDHFLGRSDVINILGVRFANRMLEPIWNNQHVESIEVVYDESLALEGRAGYYDHAGALMDMVQSHLLQVMALLMMDPISRIDERELRAAKAQVLRNTRLRGGPRGAGRRARYTAGELGGHRVPAYTREDGVDPRRRTETLAELDLEVDTWRWAGVPVKLRSGKALGQPRKEAVVTLKRTPHLPDGLVGHDSRDRVTIGFKPARIALHLDVSGPGDPFALDSADPAADLADGDLPAYGEVLAGVLDGDPLLAVRGDNAEECWRIVEPVLESWRADEVPMETYAAGSEGPRTWSR